MKQWPLLLIAGITLALMVGLSDVSALESTFQSPLPTPTSTATHTATWTPTPTITPTPTAGPPLLAPAALCGRVGDVVTVDGANFVAGALVNITWSGMALGTTPSPVQADPAGRFRFSFVVPNDYAGPHLVRASDGLRVAQFTFSLGQDCLPPTPTETSTPVPSPTPTETATPTTTPPAEAPRLRCEPDASVPEQVIYVYGENFHPGGHFYQLRWGGVVIPWAPNGLTVGDDGKFTLWFAAPSDSYEIHTLVADDGKGGLAECYIDLMPRDPTSTWTPTATLTPTPTATWTPGPPPRITITPTLEPSPFEHCMQADAVFTRDPLVDTRIDAGIVLTNTNTAWEDNRVQVAVWQYYRLQVSDIGARFGLPSLTGGQSLTLRQQFQTTQYAGPVWFQVRLVNTLTGQASVCTSPWFVLYAQDDEPYPPPLLEPPDNVWLPVRQLDMDWLGSGIPDGAGPVDSYEVHLLDLGSGDLLYQQTGADITAWPHLLHADYGARQLAWRARAHNSGGWGRWATALYFGVDTTRPVVDIALAGMAGTNDWWVSPLIVRLGGSDPAPGSGLKATYLQVGDGRWEQVIPGGASEVDMEGQFKLRAYGRDWALNRSLIRVEPVKIDLHAPHNLAANFAYDATSSGWYTAPVTISITAEDAVSGVAQRLVRVDGGGWQPDAFLVQAEGIHDVEFMARDGAGNETQIRRTTAKLDLTPPDGAIALNGTLCQTCEPMIATLAGGDGASGLGHWTLSMVLPSLRLRASIAGHSGLASPLRQSETVLASGSGPAEEVTLDGGELPVGQLALRLAVQDVAGWVSTRALTVTNAGAAAGPTPTPWLMATATPWPTTTPGAMPYATITPTPGRSGGDDGGDGDDDDGGGSGGGDGGGSGNPAGYPVGGTVVPAILPVTGSAGFSPLLLLVPLLLFVGWLCWRRLDLLFFESDEDFMARMKREGLLNNDDRSIE